MFTGIIEEVGRIKELKKTGSYASITIEASKVLSDVKLGDSIAVNGVCLTVTGFDAKSFTTSLSDETLNVTKFSSIKVDDKVNLERALKLSDRLSGHLVTGHIDCVGTVLERIDKGDFSVFLISFNPDFERYVIKKGSIAIDGVSLTINDVIGNSVRLNIIPHTLEMTNLKFMNVSAKVNIEFDIIGKYIESLLSKKDDKKNSVMLELLEKSGYLGGKIL